MWLRGQEFRGDREQINKTYTTLEGVNWRQITIVNRMVREVITEEVIFK